MSGYLTSRQRTGPPSDRMSARRGPSGGGYDRPSPRTLAPGLDTELTRFPTAPFDQGVTYDRGPYYDRDTPPTTGNGWVNWTAAGPTRPELHMRCYTMRTWVGNTRSRYPVADTPTGGLHTYVTPGVARTVPRYVTVPQMQAARQDRLQPGQYAGQTYSQTTRLQGGRAR